MCPLGLPLWVALLVQAVVLPLLSTAADVPPVSSAHSWPPERASVVGACSRTSPIAVGYADALVQVLPNVSHAALDTIDTITLAGARQQRVDFQLVLTPHLGSVPVDVTLALKPRVRGADPAVGTVSPDVRRVDNVNIVLASNAAKRTGLFPDPLRETASGKVPPDGLSHAVFWVTVSIPSSAEDFIAGIVDITDATTGSQLCAVPYNVRVWNFTVPAASSETAQLTGAELSLSYAIPGNHSYYNPEGIPIEVVRTAMSNMFDHRINTQVFAAIYPPIALNISGDLSKVEINTTHFDDQVEWLLARGLRQFRFPTPSGCGLAIKCGSTDPVHGDHKAENASVNEWTFPGGKRLHIFKNVPAGHSPICELSSKFEDVFRRMHMPVVHHLKAKGWLNKTLVVLQDEPAWNDALTVCEWLAMAQLYKSLDPSIRIWQDRWPAGYTSNRATLDSLYGAVGTSGTWIPDPLQYQGDQAAIKSAAERGVSFLSYDNAVPIIDLSPIRTRTFFWTVWRTNFDPVSVRKVAGLKGSLSWYGLSNWAADPYASANSPYDKAPHYRPAGLVRA